MLSRRELNSLGKKPACRKIERIKMRREIDEEQVKRDMILINVRDYIRKRGFATMDVILENLYHGFLIDELESADYDVGNFIKDVCCADIYYVQFGKDQSSLWYYDPHRKKHLIENISGIGPEQCLR